MSEQTDMITINNKQRRILPKERAFLDAYLDVNSDSFGNAYQSGLKAGYTHETSLKIASQKKELISEYVKSVTLNSDELLMELAKIIRGNSDDSNKIKAITLLMKHQGMLVDKTEVKQERVNINLNYSNRGNEQ